MRLAVILGIAALIAFDGVPYPAAAAQPNKDIPFETSVFLTACTRCVPDVAMQMPMNERCISADREMCNLNSDMTGRCDGLSEVTLWLEQNSLRSRSDILHAHERLQQFSDRAAPLALLADLGECFRTKLATVPPDEICSYKETLAQRAKFRRIEMNNRTGTR